MDFLRSVLESEQAFGLAKASGQLVGTFLAEVLGPIIPSLMNML